MIQNRDRWLIPSLVVGVIAVISWSMHFPDPNLITFDVYGYYVYLPAAFTFHDLGFFGFVENHFDAYDLLSGPYQVMATGGHRVPIYTVGLAILAAPFYILADLVAQAAGYPRDGLSFIYQLAFWASSICYCWIGIRFLVLWLERYLDRQSLWISVLAVAFGTNYLIYATWESGLTHGYIFSLYAVLFFLSDRWSDSGRLKYALLIALLVALMCLVRPTEVISLVIPAGYLVRRKGVKGFLKIYWKQLLAMVIVGFVVILPQMIFWKLNTGHWIWNAYMAHGHEFHLTQPHLLEGLFSWRKGWLLYTPMMALSLFGLYSLHRKRTGWFWPILLYLLLHTWITFSWGMWWYASSFGSRPMVHAYAALALPLGSLFMARKKKDVLYLLAVFFASLNILQSWQYVRKILPGDGINRIFYWKSFGKLRHDPELIKYVDLEHALPGLGQYQKVPLTTRTYARNEPHTDDQGLVDQEGMPAEMVTPDRTYSKALVHKFSKPDLSGGKEGRWLYVEAELFREGDGFNAYNIAQLSVSFHQDDRAVMVEGVRFPFYLDEGIWKTTGFEIPVPEGIGPGGLAKVYVWNPSPDTIYVHRLSLFGLEKGK